MRHVFRNRCALLAICISRGTISGFDAFRSNRARRHGAIAHAELVVEILEVILHGVLRDPGPGRDLEIGPAIGKHRKQLALTPVSCVYLVDVDVGDAERPRARPPGRLENDRRIVELEAIALRPKARALFQNADVMIVGKPGYAQVELAVLDFRGFRRRPCQQASSR